MPAIVTIGSGKGGTGKSMVISNIACLLARCGRKVCLVDLDVGGANAHLMLGQFNPPMTLTDFLTRKAASLEEVIIPYPRLKNLGIIAGTGDTLKTSNMPFATKRRLIRHLAKLDADVVLVDVGAGTHYHALDFFMLGDYQLCVTTPDPTSTLDLYKFVKLATIRKILSNFVSHEKISKTLLQEDFKTIEDILRKAEESDPQNREKAESALNEVHFMLIVNRVSKGTMVSIRNLERLLSEYLGVKLEKLGEIPADNAVEESIHFLMPVCEVAPNSPASKALYKITDNLIWELSKNGLGKGA